MEILFWRHQTKGQKRTGKCMIYCRVTINGERKDIGSTNIEVEFDHFNTEKGKITYQDPFFVEKNTRLQEEFERPILTIYNEFSIKGKPFSAKMIKERFLSSGESLRLMDVYERYLKNYERLTYASDKNKRKRKKAKRSKSTLRPLTTCKNKLLTYLLKNQMQGEAVENIPSNFINKYEQWLWELGHEQSTVVKHLRTLKQVTNWAKKEEKIIRIDPFEDITVEREEEHDPEFLTQEQFECWRDFKFRSKAAQECADLFVVYCRTAFHYIDLKQVIDSPTDYFKKGLDGKPWIYKPREKTDEVAKVPVSAFEDLNPIIEKYGGWDKLPIKSNEKMNEWLKVCVAEVNMYLPEGDRIYEALSVKHGRTTFSNWWINTLGRSTESLLPIMGRRSAYGLGRYVRPDERAVIAALKNL